MRAGTAITSVAVLGLSLSALWLARCRGAHPAPPAAPPRILTSVAAPSAVADAWDAPVAAAGAWLDFQPPADDFTPAELDLRASNEARAGDAGPLVVSGHTLVRGGAEQRFWGVNTRERVLLLSDAEMTVFARSLAKRGVNLVRLHFRFWNEADVRAVDAKRLERTHRLVAELANAGISSALSIFFPYWLKPKAADVPGYDGNKRAFGLLYADAGFREMYRGWWRQILTPKNPYTGRSLAEDPAVAMLELVNEDSTLWWTFETNGQLPPPQSREIEQAFGRFLAKRHGSVAAGLARFGGGPERGDAPAEGRAGLVSPKTIARTTSARTRETAEFLAVHMRDTYAELRRYLVQDLGARALVVCSNWITASGRVLGPLDKWANGACDVMDQHGYFAGPHTGKDATYLILAGQRYDDRSALIDEQGDRDRTLELPTSAVSWQEKPGIVSELGWPSPNRFRAEMPLLALAYGSLAGTSGFGFFTTESPGYASSLTKFGLADPTALGQFPAAALAFRRGYVAAGKVVASAQPSLGDLFLLRGGPLGTPTLADALRRPDGPGDGREADASTFDPFAALVGKEEITVSERAGPTALADLGPFVDRRARIVRSSTGELSLDLARGLFSLNAPRAQGVAGFLGRAAPLELSVLRVESALEYGAVLAVSLDDEPLGTSKKILLQVASEVENTGFRAPGKGLRTIEDPGRGPIRMKAIDARVALARPDFERMRAVALDANGRRVREAKRLAGGLVLLPDTLYYLLTAP